ncbi:putative tau-tubulin kinase 1 isoform X1 [Sesbania bispinosa]|nr:putative tau-tubulin kinase 1 isoform X1 [Sesbania bispinosa]
MTTKIEKDFSSATVITRSYKQEAGVAEQEQLTIPTGATEREQARRRVPVWKSETLPDHARLGASRVQATMQTMKAEGNGCELLMASLCLKTLSACGLRE